MYATVHWAERKSRRKRQKEGEEDTILYAETLEIEQKESSENVSSFFLSPSNLPEKLISLFFHDIEKEILEIFALESCAIIVSKSLGIFLLLLSRKRRVFHHAKLFRGIFISFFFFQKNYINFNSR